MASIYKIASGWRAQVRVKDKPTSSRILPSKREAQLWAREEEERLHKSTSDNPNATFADILEVYSAHARPGGKTKRWTLARLKEHWACYRMTEINSGAVARYAMVRRRDGAGPATVLQDLVYLSVVLAHGGVLAGNREAAVARLEIAAAIKSLRHTGTIATSEERNRRPTEAELRTLELYWESQRKLVIPMMDILLFAICTTMRMGEIVGRKGVTFEDLDINARTIWVRDRKDPTSQSGRTDCIPLLVGPVSYQGSIIDPIDIIQRQPTFYARKGRIFPYSKSGIGNGFCRAVKKCGIVDLHFHDMRHEGISRLFEYGLDIPKVAAVSGHKSWKHLERYTHIRPEAVQRSF